MEKNKTSLEYSGQLKAGDFVVFKNPVAQHKGIHVILMKLDPDQDDDISQTGPKYLLRSPEHKKVTAYEVELFKPEGN